MQELRSEAQRLLCLRNLLACLAMPEAEPARPEGRQYVQLAMPDQQLKV